VSYRCSTIGMAHLGIPDGDCRIICDVCGTTKSARTRSGGPPSWLLKGRTAPGWVRGSNGDGTRWDKCQNCKGVV